MQGLTLRSPLASDDDAERDAAARADDDAALVASAQRDYAAFGPLYDRYAESVYRYCYRRMGSHEAAADATSQTFLKALAALPRYRAGSFRGWLFAIAANVVTDVHRRRGVGLFTSDPSLVEAVVDRAPGPEAVALAAEERQSVGDLLARLTPEQRHVVELRLAGLTGPEIATALGISIAAVRSSQFRAYTRLRRWLEPDDAEARERGRDDA